MNRRNFISLTGAGALSSCVSNIDCPSPVRRTKWPNVLLIIVDQMRRPIWFEHPLPNYERMIVGGVDFTSHYCNAVPCSPSRACIMTGLYREEHRVLDNLHRKNNIQPDMNKSLITLGDLAQLAGYDTGYFGKWHLSQEVGGYGFDVFTDDHWGCVDAGCDHDEHTTELALNWIHNRKSPWFAVAGLVNPHDVCYVKGTAHTPLEMHTILPDNIIESYMGVDECFERLDYYYYFTRKMDDCLGTILDNTDRDTLVIFTSDHGEMCGSYGLTGKRAELYAENIHVPMVMQWSGLDHKAIKERTSSIDIFRTLWELWGYDPSVLAHGSSLLSSIPKNRRIYFSCYRDEKELKAWF